MPPPPLLRNGGGKGSFLRQLCFTTGEARTLLCHFDRGSEATEWRNLLGKGVGSQIPPLAALGRDDKRRKAAR